MRKALILIGCSVLFLGCASTYSGSNEAEAFIRAATERFTSAFNSGDWEGAVANYAADVVVMPPNAEIVRGPADARAFFSSMASMRPNLTINTERVEQSCDLAFDYGTFEFKMTPPGASMITDRGKYISVWRRMPNGDWKVVGDIFNSSLPAPGM